MQSAYNATVLNAWEGYPESLASPDTGQNRWERRSGVIFVERDIVFARVNSCVLNIGVVSLIASLGHRS
jgi:hypothetical protein